MSVWKSFILGTVFTARRHFLLYPFARLHPSTVAFRPSPCSHWIPVPLWHLLPSSFRERRTSVGSFSARTLSKIFPSDIIQRPRERNVFYISKLQVVVLLWFRQRSANLHAVIFNRFVLHSQTFLTKVNPAVWPQLTSVGTRINLGCPPPSPLRSTATQLRAPLGCHNTAHITEVSPDLWGEGVTGGQGSAAAKLYCYLMVPGDGYHM